MYLRERWTWKPWIPIALGIFAGWMFLGAYNDIFPSARREIYGVLGRFIISSIGSAWGVHKAWKDRQEGLNGWTAPFGVGILVILHSILLVFGIRLL
jgi:hypothetical protein